MQHFNTSPTKCRVNEITIHILRVIIVRCADQWQEELVLTVVIALARSQVLTHERRVHLIGVAAGNLPKRDLQGICCTSLLVIGLVFPMDEPKSKLVVPD